MQSLYCSNCKVEINSSDIKEHYKSEFHRYNTKRQLVDLPPLTDEQYQQRQKLLAQKQEVKEEDLKCKTCHKTFATKMTYEQHLNSHKHKEKVKQEEYAKKNKSAEEKPVFKEPLAKQTTVDAQYICLFCNKQSSDIDCNISHMSIDHGFFISSAKHVQNLTGLLKYLGKKVQKGFLCLYCESQFQSGEGTQRHMIDKSHCFMQDENIAEYAKYYNLSSLLNECNVRGEDKSESKGQFNEEAYCEIVIDDNENEWSWDEEDDPQEESKGGEKVRRIRVAKAVLLPTAEIKLPNGKLLGHREFKQYYQQNIRPNLLNQDSNNPTPEESEEIIMINQDKEIMLQERRDEIRAKEKEDRINHKEMHKQEVEFLKLGLQGNKLQPHMRKQVLV